ncbi:hypothetical protein DPMN_087184 [Dreissena polymorpha]|uniref:Uncharacterized protein n=1 Tax=Dreissena polymorpha TaxID=45954 RepID=A0A9D4QVV7_DREPO|nr:hypothetical protein DPMN_087184 [Dreissena polymorpha]
MECRARNQLECQATLVQAQIDLLDANLAMHRLALKRIRRQRRWWIRAWLGPERRRQFGLYDQLMVKLRREDQHAFINIMRMPTEIFDEILARVLNQTQHRHPFLSIKETSRYPTLMLHKLLQPHATSKPEPHELDVSPDGSIPAFIFYYARGINNKSCQRTARSTIRVLDSITVPVVKYKQADAVVIVPSVVKSN